MRSHLATSSGTPSATACIAAVSAALSIRAAMAPTWPPKPARFLSLKKGEPVWAVLRSRGPNARDLKSHGVLVRMLAY